VRGLLLLEKLSDFSLHLLSGFFVAELVLAHDVLEIDISSNQVSSGHKVVIVHNLHEWLHLGSSLDFLLAHSSGHLQCVSFNASYQGVSEFLVLWGKMSPWMQAYLLSVIVLLHNDCFLSSMSSSKKNDNSSRFHSKDKKLTSDIRKEAFIPCSRQSGTPPRECNRGWELDESKR